MSGPRLRAWSLVAFAPVLLVFYGNWCFIANHFALAPFLHDSGWFASIVFREGIMPRNPVTVANDVTYYWGWHVSPLISAGSLVSYLFPGDVIDWYGVFQGIVYAPLATAVPVLVDRETRRGMALAVLVAATSLVFAFNGQVLAAVGYPHFELFASAGLALMLAALAVGRERLAWVGIAMAVATREDGGLHAASFLAAALAAGLLGRPFPVARRRLATMTAVALACSVVATLVQNKLFVTPRAWEIYLVGKPPFAHLSWAVLVQRLSTFGARSGFVWAPMLATLAVAAYRRDARYLLGWLVTVPWLLLNFTAKQDVKAEMGLYTGFPFVGSAFWVGAYARTRAGRSAPQRKVLWPLAAVSLASLAGLSFSYPGFVRGTLENMLVRSDVDRAAIRAYARALATSPDAYGRLLVDASVAAWTVKSAKREALVADGRDPGIDTTKFDGVTFFERGPLRETVPALLARGDYTSCGNLPRTPVMFCGRRGSPLPPGFRPASATVHSLDVTVLARHEGERIQVLRTARPEVGIFGPFVSLDGGRYEAVFHVRVDECPIDRTPRMFIEVFNGGVLAKRTLERGEREVRLPFTLEGPGPHRGIELRAWSGECPYWIDGVELEKR